jgi:peptide deformylase
MTTARPSQAMSDIGVAQHGHPILRTPAEPFDLPAEAEDARVVVAALVAAAARIAAVHPFAKGMGLAAPQIGIPRAAALVYPPGQAEPIVLLNPEVVEQSPETDEQYEGCLSFFDVRGMVPRPLQIVVQTVDLSGQIIRTEFDTGLARLVAHEIDHLGGRLYLDIMRAGVEPIGVDEYRGTGAAWDY